MENEIIITTSPNLSSLSNNVPPTNSWSNSLSNVVPGTDQSIVSSTGFFSHMNWTRILLILLVLSFLGVNIFSRLSEITEWFNNTIAPIFKKTFGVVGEKVIQTTEKTIDMSAEGAKTGIDIVAGTLDSGLEVIGGQLQNSKSNNKQNNTLLTALSTSLPQFPEPDEATSSTQTKYGGKAGFCYIGEDRGIRSCVKVNEDNVCMSGQIFPSSDICVNPNLRE